jgi:hypothetical protein
LSVLLVHALAEDYADRISESAAQRRLVAGPAFGRAVLSNSSHDRRRPQAAR